ncbi:hypothetical protein [Shewanella morhuae]|nr:hypothetical protein [Shewanella morhuae]GIU07468.1 hypothetical protein TUM4641_20080 [Shewanella morhuae]
MKQRQQPWKGARTDGLIALDGNGTWNEIEWMHHLFFMDDDGTALDE